MKHKKKAIASKTRKLSKVDRLAKSFKQIFAADCEHFINPRRRKKIVEDPGVTIGLDGRKYHRILYKYRRITPNETKKYGRWCNRFDAEKGMSCGQRIEWIADICPGVVITACSRHAEQKA